MTIRTYQALDALATRLSGRAPLPELSRDQKLPGRFAADDEGSGRHFVLRTGTAENREQLLGGAERHFEIDHMAEIEWLVENKDRAARVATFNAGLEEIDNALEEDPTLGGVVDHAEISGTQFNGLVTEGVPEIEAAILSVRLTFTSTRPF